MSNDPAETVDVVIVGGGPAGASAAVFTARAGLRTLVVDGDKGITRRAMLNNHFGFPDGITGPELVDRGRAHAEAAGATWVVGDVTAVDGSDGSFTVTTADGRAVAGARIILATGMSVAVAEAAGATIAEATEPRIKAIVKVDGQGRTTVPGIWAAGTVAGASVHTVVTAGDGARVAINLISEVRGERHVDHDVLPAG
ncbi:MAG: FAD-dependent oxidoreductase [Desertimonas sp.]